VSVFAKRPDGTLAMLDEYPVSTGRERNEVNAVYESSFDSMGRAHAPCHVFNWTRDGLETSLAIHAATDDQISPLGARQRRLREAFSLGR